MDIQTKHRVELLNAKCNYVCAVDSLVNKMNYGEDVNCCINKLYLASRLINRLDCYCFDSVPIGDEEISSVLTLSGTNSSYSAGSIGQIIVNGVQLGALTTPITVSESNGIKSLLDLINYDYTLISGDGIYKFTVTGAPDITSIRIIISDSSIEINLIDFDLTTNGVLSSSECYNCITDKDLPKMYEVLDSFLK